MRVALVHDWLTGMRGGERCLAAFLKLFPEADIYTLLHKPGASSSLIDSRVRKTSLLQRLPLSPKLYRYYLPLYPAIASLLKVRGYDLVISLSHAAAKNISVEPGVPHICYCFTPMRYIWDQSAQYFGRMTPLAGPLLAYLRRWDKQGSRSLYSIIAISRFVAARIREFYGLRAPVIYPPVDVSWIDPAGRGVQGEAFLYAGALVPYKRVDLVIDVFNQLGEPLWISGGGPEEARLRTLAGKNVRFLGRLSDADLAATYRSCRALVFPAIEDFGMVPVECMAAGRPVIACYKGGSKETIRGAKIWEQGWKERMDECSGVFYRAAPDPRAELTKAVRAFLEVEGEISAEACTIQAAKFAPRRFFEAWERVLGELRN